MGTLYLVRHGQASFGAADYDQLSELGTRQCQALGQWFAQRGIAFEAVLRGTLKRHVQSLDGIAQGLAQAGGGALPAALPWPGLNEYDSAALIRTVHAGPLAKPDNAEVYKAHFRLLREALGLWMAGQTQPEGMPSWADFSAGVAAALDHVRHTHQGAVLLVSSGGPIATAVHQVLGTPASSAIELNLRIRNSALSEFSFTPKGHRLLSYNHLPHLDHPDRRTWETYA
ncbi:phosphoglycerate kinase [beta proteobacterium AAP51]|nr:phosphoglycerate kinase [beta proteobacterium AAP51]